MTWLSDPPLPRDEHHSLPNSQRMKDNLLPIAYTLHSHLHQQMAIFLQGLGKTCYSVG
jgi:hypothetical protein